MQADGSGQAGRADGEAQPWDQGVGGLDAELVGWGRGGRVRTLKLLTGGSGFNFSLNDLALPPMRSKVPIYLRDEKRGL